MGGYFGRQIAGGSSLRIYDLRWFKLHIKSRLHPSGNVTRSSTRILEILFIRGRELRFNNTENNRRPVEHKEGFKFICVSEQMYYDSSSFVNNPRIG